MDIKAFDLREITKSIETENGILRKKNDLSVY